MNGTIRSDSLIIYAAISAKVVSDERITYSNLYSEFFEGDTLMLCLELASECHRFFDEGGVLWVA